MSTMVGVSAEELRAPVVPGPPFQFATRIASEARVACSQRHARIAIGKGTSLESARGLVQRFGTCPLTALEPALRRHGVTMPPEGGPPSSGFVFLALAPNESAWSASQSAGQRLPIVSALFGQFRVRPSKIERLDWGVATDARHVYDVFHVETAVGSANVPDQEGFVREYTIRSPVAFGCTCGHGDLFAVIVLCQPPLADHAIRGFHGLALNASTCAFRLGHDARHVSTSVPWDNSREYPPAGILPPSTHTPTVSEERR
jgi:hypothetical protein